MTAKRKPALTEVADGRSKAARRMKELIQNFTTELGGGDLSPSEETIVENAAMARMKSEDVRARMSNGDHVPDEDVVRVGRLTSLAMRDLNAAKAKRKTSAKPASIEHFLAEEFGEEDPDGEIEEVDFILPPEDEPSYRPPVEVEPVAPPPVAKPEPTVEPAKPQGLVEVFYDARPGHAPAQTLAQIVGALQARNIARVKFTTSATQGDRAVDTILAEVGPVLAGKCCWHVRGLE